VFIKPELQPESGPDVAEPHKEREREGEREGEREKETGRIYFTVGASLWDMFFNCLHTKQLGATYPT